MTKIWTLILVVSLIRTMALAQKTDSPIPFNVSIGVPPIIFNPDLTYGTVTDKDGNIYKTIDIGTQTWMAENLKTTHYNDGTPIPNDTIASHWKGLSTGAYCWYNNNAAYKNSYGALYNWYAAINTSKVCPIGWHVPLDSEWTILSTFSAIDAAHLKETGTSHWYSLNTSADNSTGFTAIPAGYCWDDGSFGNMGNDISGWSSSESSADNAYILYLYYGNNNVSRVIHNKKCGFSIRCLKDINATTDVNLLNSKESGNLKLYPNPVIDQLQINYEAKQAENMQVEIVDLQGKILHQQTLNCQYRTNQVTISTAQLPSGLYLFRLQSTHVLETVKFYKQ